jgi:hypothetical protein
VAFGGVCMTAGAMLASAVPPWLPQGCKPTAGLWSALLGAPAGWIVWLLAVPGAGFLARSAWRTAHVAESRSDRISAWSLFGVTLAGGLTCAFVIWRAL